MLKGLRQKGGVVVCVFLAILLFVGYMKYREFADFKKILRIFALMLQ